MPRDFLDKIIAERAAGNPNFPQMVQEAIARQDRARQNSPKENDGSVVAKRVIPQGSQRRRVRGAHKGRKTPVLRTTQQPATKGTAGE
jgi:ribosomal protein L15E